MSEHDDLFDGLDGMDDDRRVTIPAKNLTQMREIMRNLEKENKGFREQAASTVWDNLPLDQSNPSIELFREKYAKETNRDTLLAEATKYGLIAPAGDGTTPPAGQQVPPPTSPPAAGMTPAEQQAFQPPSGNAPSGNSPQERMERYRAERDPAKRIALMRADGVEFAE